MGGERSRHLPLPGHLGGGRTHTFPLPIQCEVSASDFGLVSAGGGVRPLPLLAGGTIAPPSSPSGWGGSHVCHHVTNGVDGKGKNLPRGFMSQSESGSSKLLFVAMFNLSE